jgi:Zn-finger nucleic acid-binding protein
VTKAMSCPKCRAPLEANEVSDGVVVHNCPSCYGVLYGDGDIAVPLKLIGIAPARFDCPSCSRPMETGKAYDGQIELDRCKACGVVWFDAGEIQILRKLSGVENLAGKPPADDEAPVVPVPAPPKPAKKEGVLHKKTTDDEPVGPKPPEMEGARNEDASRAPTVELDGRTYRHFQTSVPVTTSVLGEFPWIAKVGDTARMRDFICPPYLLSQEVTATESVWSAGEYIEPEEVWAAFALPGAPPAKTGVNPAQPNPWASQLPAIWTAFGLAAAVCAGSYFYFSAASSNSTVYEGPFSVTAADVERSRVGEIFEVKGRTSNLEVLLDTNLDGHWASVDMALIDADTDQAIDFSRELSYYHGYEDGENWSEGGRYETFYVPRVPPGRYYLRVEPETDAPQLNLRVVVKRDVPLARLPLIALILLVLPAVWAGMRHDAFENTRWMESDHPRTSSGGDDDGDDE